MRKIIFAMISVLFAGAAMADLPLATGPGICGAASLQHLVGLPARTLTVDGLSDASHVYHVFGDIRIVYPGNVSTTYYDPTRLNFYLDDAGNILKLACG